MKGEGEGRVSGRPGKAVVTWALKEEEDGQAFPVGGAAYRQLEGGQSVGAWRKAVGQVLEEQVWAGVREGGGWGNEVTNVVRDQLGLTSICRHWGDREGNTQRKSLFLGCCDMVWSVGEKGRGQLGWWVLRWAHQRSQNRLAQKPEGRRGEEGWDIFRR